MQPPIPPIETDLRPRVRGQRPSLLHVGYSISLDGTNWMRVTNTLPASWPPVLRVTNAATTITNATITDVTDQYYPSSTYQALERRLKALEQRLNEEQARRQMVPQWPQMPNYVPLTNWPTLPQNWSSNVVPNGFKTDVAWVNASYVTTSNPPVYWIYGRNKSYVLHEATPYAHGGQMEPDIYGHYPIGWRTNISEMRYWENNILKLEYADEISNSTKSVILLDLPPRIFQRNLGDPVPPRTNAAQEQGSKGGR